MRILLTDVAIKRLNPPEKGQLKIWDTKLPGFGLLVGKRTKSFLVVTGKDRRNQTLGRYPDLSLKDARNKAKVLLVQKHDKSSQRGVLVAIQAYLEDCQDRVKPTTVIEYRRHLNKAPNKKLSELKKSDLDLSEAQAIKTWKIFYNWCIRHELTDRNPFAHLQVKYGKRDRLLTNEELKAIWEYDHEPYSDILKLLLLTGQRRNQIWQLQPDWIEEGVINFPPEVMKSGLSHTIPIGSLTQELVKKAPFTFNSWSKAKARCDKHTGVTNWTVHDLRRVFVTKCAETGEIPLHVTETYVDHRSGTISGVQAIYLKYDFMREMKKLVDTYEEYLQTILA